MTLRIGDVADVLPTLESESVQMCVTSPPYWGLRDYGVDGQLGLESTPEEYVAKMVDVFREVRRVLKDDGTLWLNLGDSYAGSGKGPEGNLNAGASFRHLESKFGAIVPNGLKPKDLVGIPWRVAFALQADGWVLRQEIIWQKPNPMPESVTDRCTKAHEQIFLFAKASWSGPAPAEYAHISEGDARWLATLIDTEGCIVVKRVNHDDKNATYAPQVSLGSTHRPLLEKVAAVVGQGNVLERGGKNAPMYYWQLANAKANALLYRIYPHLMIKPRQARIAMHVHSLTYYRGGKLPERKKRNDTEESQLMSLWERNKACNQFGKPDLSDVPEPKYGGWSGCQRYYFDAEAIAERLATAAHAPGNKKLDASRNDHDQMTKVWGANGLRNRRSVWTVNSQPYAEAHFATFPPKLIEPCILAGSRSGDIVLDPFFGSGTTGEVCERLGRKWLGIELNPEYGDMAKRRTSQQGFVF